MDPFSDDKHPDYVHRLEFRNWIEALDEDDYQFEKVTEDVHERLGWDCTRTQRARDGGYDVRPKKPGQERLVEVKHKVAVGPAVVREIAGTALKENVTEVSVVAISFTDGAFQEAEEIREIATSPSSY